MKESPSEDSRLKSNFAQNKEKRTKSSLTPHRCSDICTIWTEHSIGKDQTHGPCLTWESTNMETAKFRMSRLLWPCITNVVWRERERERGSNKMQLVWYFLSNFYLNMFRASFYTSSSKQRFCATAYYVCTLLTSQLHTTTANHRQHNQCRTPHAVAQSLILLVMSIMVPETCWDRSLIINIRLVASCWFLSLHPLECHIIPFTKTVVIFLTFFVYQIVCLLPMH